MDKKTIPQIMSDENEELLTRYASIRKQASIEFKQLYDRIIDLFETSYKNNQTLLTEDYIRYYFSYKKGLETALKDLIQFGVLRLVNLNECYIEEEPEEVKTDSVQVKMNKSVFYTMFLDKSEIKRMFYSVFQKSLIKVIEKSSILMANPETYPITHESLNHLSVSPNLLSLSLKILYNNHQLNVLNIPVFKEEDGNKEVDRHQIYFLPSMASKSLQILSRQFSDIYTQQKQFFNNCLSPEIQQGLFVPVKNKGNEFIFNPNDIGLLSTIILKYSSAFPLIDRVAASRALLIIGTMPVEDIQEEKVIKQDTHIKAKKQNVYDVMIQQLYNKVEVIPEENFLEMGKNVGLNSSHILELLNQFPRDILSFKIRNNQKSLTYFVAMKHLFILYERFVIQKSPIAPIILAAWQAIFYKYSLNQMSLSDLLEKIGCTENDFWSIFNQLIK